MMLRRFLALLVILLSAPVVAADTVSPAFAARFELPDWFKISFLDLREDVAEAAAEDKRLMLFFYQDGCPYCEKLLNTNLSQRDIRQTVQTGLDVIAINLWGDREVTDLDGRLTSEKQFSAGLGIMFTPTVVFLDEQGRTVLRINGYYGPARFKHAIDYVTSREEVKGSFRDYLARQDKPMAQGELNSPAAMSPQSHDLRSLRHAEKRPLLIVFEQQDCPNCDELNREAFTRSDTRVQLAKFTIARLNMWSDEMLVTPDGRRIPTRQWARELNVQYAPSLIFFDGGDHEVFRSEAYLRPFHVQSVMDYVASGAYKTQPSFQRYLEERADRLRENQREVRLWE